MKKIKSIEDFPPSELSDLRRQLADLKRSEARLKLIEQVLRESQLRFAGILDISNEAIICVDRQQKITLFNKGAEEIFGYLASETVGKPLDMLIPARKVTKHQDLVEIFGRSEDAARLMGERQAVFGRRKNGQEFPAEASISKLALDDETIFTVVLRDITARKRAEAEREGLIAELKALNQAARAITSELSLERVLQTIVEAVRALLKVKYAALGVHDGHGYLSRFITAGMSPALHAKIGSLPAGKGLLGMVLHKGESLIVNDISSHPHVVGFPTHHPHMTSFLGVPIFSKGRLIGALYLADKEDGSDLTEADKDLVEMLALHAAIAIENARLYEQTQQLALMEERERFARDLHDGIIQSLYAVGLTLEQVKLDIDPVNNSAKDHIDRSVSSLATTIQDIRSYIFDLRPQAMHQKGLKARLEGLIQELKVNIRLPITARISPDIDAYLTEQQASHIFHISHEALSNAARHARANHILLSLTREAEELTLCIEDDGVGFKKPADINPGHRGLANIQGRVLQLGADFDLDSHPRRGTRLQVTVRGRKPLN